MTMKKKREKKKKKKMSQQETKYYSYYIYTPTGAEDLYSNLVTDLVYLLCCLLASLQRLLSPSSFLYCICTRGTLLVISVTHPSSSLHHVGVTQQQHLSALTSPVERIMGNSKSTYAVDQGTQTPPLPSLWAPSRSTPTTDALSLSKFTSTTSSC